MPKVFQTPKGGRDPGAAPKGEKEPGVQKTFGVYDRPVQTSPAMMIGIVVIAALILLVVVLLMMHR